MVWGSFCDNAWRIRLVAGLGGAWIAGIETGHIMAKLTRRGVDIDLAEDLVAACERGFVAASNRKDNQDGEGLE